MQENKKIVDLCYSVYNQYSWLINSYVMDFFIEKHWNKFSVNVQEALENLNTDQIAQLLDYDASMKNYCWPLSILALKQLLEHLSLSRKSNNETLLDCCSFNNEKILKSFWQRVKFKKRHEISLMAKMCYKTAQETDCFYIVDVGSGLGHLSRMLNYGYGFKICTIEVQELLSKGAGILDNQFEKMLKKHNYNKNFTKTVHINQRLDFNISVEEFLEIIKKAFGFQEDSFQFGIVGLHPCGDLGATLLRLYSNCEQIKFINIVGCCYMKLSSTSPNPGFPLSQYYQSKNYQLDYNSKEVACHAIENYVEKMRYGEGWKLKIHAYRALIEQFIVNYCPDLRHSALSNVHCTEDLTFEHYCEKALIKLNLKFPDGYLKKDIIKNYLEDWKKVVVFSSLRLLFAPLVETIILLDRLIYIWEMGSKGEIISVFDPKISPRTHILTAQK